MWSNRVNFDQIPDIVLGEPDDVGIRMGNGVEAGTHAVKRLVIAEPTSEPDKFAGALQTPEKRRLRTGRIQAEDQPRGGFPFPGQNAVSWRSRRSNIGSSAGVAGERAPSRALLAIPVRSQRGRPAPPGLSGSRRLAASLPIGRQRFARSRRSASSHRPGRTRRRTRQGPGGEHLK